jgi:peptidoglycan/xylan/chitin deacetylase (PgdA/CDA1 family)
MIRRTLAPPLLALTRAAALRRPPKGAVRLVILHDVPEAKLGALRRLALHAKARFGLATPEWAAERLAGKGRADGAAPVLFGFDDGFVSNWRATWEVLDPLGAKALFFVCPGLIDLPPAGRAAAVAERVFRGRVADPPELMGWKDLRALAEAGHAIGCHGFDHAALSGLSDADLHRQVAVAAQRLEDMMGRPTPWFAFPFGDIASIDAQALAAIGARFRLCRSGVRGLAHAGSHPLALPAESVDLSAPWHWQCLALEGGLAPLYRSARARLTAMAREQR